MTEKQIPGDQYQKSNLPKFESCSPCRPHAPDYSYKHAISYLRIDPKITDPNARGWPMQEDLIKLGSARRVRQFAPSIGGWKSFCTECRGVLEVDYHRGESVCSECGLTDNIPLMEEALPIKNWKDPIETAKRRRFDKKGKELLAAIVGRVDREPEENWEKVKEIKNNGMIDRRIEIIIKSLKGDDRIVDLGLTHGKMPIIQRIYNATYGPIERDPVKDSYKRFVKLQTRRIDHFIERILFRTLSNGWERIIDGRTRADTLTEKYFPGRFIYIGTERTMLRYDPMWNREKYKKFNEKALEHSRKRQVEEIIKNPKAPIIITKIYKSNGKDKKIVFEDNGFNLYFGGEESDQHFENFFLSEALKRGYLRKCPGTNKECPAATERFRRRFSLLGGFLEPSFYDAAPYLPQSTEEPKKCD
jgi:hypothetical protein